MYKRQASQYVNVKNESKKNIKACIFYQSYSIQLYEKDLFFDDKITTGKVKIPDVYKRQVLGLFYFHEIIKKWLPWG